MSTKYERCIFEAYEIAGIEFPFKRLKLYGIDIKEKEQKILKKKFQ